MAGPLASVAPRSWLRLPRRTARLRLTLLYAGMFLVLGTAVIGAIYVLAASGESIGSSSARAVTAVPTPSKAALARIPQAELKLATPKDLADAQHNADLNRLLVGSWFVLALTALVSAGFGWFVAGRVLRPLRDMTATAETITAGNLGERLALAGPNDEFKRLGDTFDALLTRLQASFEAQRRFVASASHELRTPLTLERTLLQVALADPDASAASLRATCEELLSSSRDQERLLEALLTLASTERGLERREPIDLTALAARVLAGLEAEIHRHGLRLHKALEPASASGDPALVERLIANLVDNAVQYNEPDGQVEVRTSTVDQRAVLEVSNTGPPISPYDVERLFEPFQRLSSHRAAVEDGHHGLGLSIVRAIVDAHGGTITVRPQPRGGLAVTVSLPQQVGQPIAREKGDPDEHRRDPSDRDAEEPR
jgi:signal transduction histidine kinase